MNGQERIRQLEQKGILNLFEGQELSGLRDEQNRLAKEAEERRLILEKEREGKKAFILKYRRGNIFQDPKDMEQVRREIWAEDATEAAEIACRMRNLLILQGLLVQMHSVAGSMFSKETN